MSAVPAEQPAGSKAAGEWAQIAAQAPQMAATLGRYLSQAATFLAPRSVEVADLTFRQFARWLLDHTDVRADRRGRPQPIEDFKLWLVAQPGVNGDGLSQNTQRQRLRMLRVFFERIIEWDWPDAPARNPIIGRDIPPRPEPLPKFLDDRDAARLMAAARAATDPRDRLVVEVLARTGLRAGELCGLDADAVVLIGDGHWLRVPVGKLRNDRYVPLHPDLVTLFADWTAANLDHIRRHRRLVADHRGILDRHLVSPHRAPRRPPRRRPRPPPPTAPHPGHPSDQPWHAPRSDRRPPRAPLDGDDPHLRPHRRPCRRRRIRRRQHPDRRPLQPATRRRRDRPDGPAPPRSPRPHARKRAVHPARRARLPHGIRLRNLRLLPTGREFIPVLLRQRTTPATTTNPTAPPSSTGSSTASRNPLDSDHPYNGGSGSVSRTLVCRSLAIASAPYARP